MGSSETEHSASQLLERGIDCHPNSDSCVRRRHSAPSQDIFIRCFLLSSDKQTFLWTVMRRRSTCRRRIRNVVVEVTVTVTRDEIVTK